MFGRRGQAGKRIPPGTAHSNAGRRITIWIYSLAALLILLSTASQAFIANLAWREADKRALEGEQLRFSKTLDDIHRQIARAQISMAQWDKLFAALQPPINRSFVENELIEDLWEDFGFNRTFIVGPKGDVLAEAIEGTTRFGAGRQPAHGLIQHIAERTRRAFEDRQRNSSSIFAEWYMPETALLDVSQSAFANVDGTPAFLSAVPVLPDDGHVNLAADYPAIMINAIYFDDEWLSTLNEQLSYNDLHFIPGAPPHMHPTNYLIHGEDGSIFGYFRWDHSKPGREIWMTALPLVIILGTIIAVVAFALANKISRLSASLEESERKNRHFARHDTLTGLPNRHHFSDCLAYSLDNVSDVSFAILACDLDEFKPVNDTYGHEAGDKVLCSVADRLRVLIGKQGVVSRIGGDEFIVLLTRLTNSEKLTFLAEQIRSAIARPIEIGGGQSVQIGVSIGIACAPDCGTTEKELIRMADVALYKAKDNGRNGFEFAGPDTDRPDAFTPDAVNQPQKQQL